MGKILKIANNIITWVLYLQSKHKYMLDKEFKYYIEHQEELVKKYNGKYIVIIGTEVIPYDNEMDAYNETLKKHKLGTFLIQLCLPGKESHTVTFHSRVVFN